MALGVTGFAVITNQVWGYSIKKLISGGMSAYHFIQYYATNFTLFLRL
jgi:hypothetical protein